MGGEEGWIRRDRRGPMGGKVNPTRFECMKLAQRLFMMI